MRLIGFIVLAAIVLSTGFAALAAPAPGWSAPSQLTAPAVSGAF